MTGKSSAISCNPDIAGMSALTLGVKPYTCSIGTEKDIREHVLQEFQRKAEKVLEMNYQIASLR